jgi:hypothetical protein
MEEPSGFALVGLMPPTACSHETKWLTSYSSPPGCRQHVEADKRVGAKGECVYLSFLKLGDDRSSGGKARISHLRPPTSQWPTAVAQLRPPCHLASWNVSQRLIQFGHGCTGPIRAAGPQIMSSDLGPLSLTHSRRLVALEWLPKYCVHTHTRGPRPGKNVAWHSFIQGMYSYYGHRALRICIMYTYIHNLCGGGGLATLETDNRNVIYDQVQTPVA